MGGYSTEKIVPHTPLIYLDTPFASTWQLKISGFRVGDKPTFNNGATSAFNIDTKVAYLDSFSPYFKLPSSCAPEIFAKFFHEVTDISKQDELLMGPCDMSMYSPLHLFVNDQYYLKIMPESYVIDIGIRGRCFLPFMFHKEDSFILGEPFFRNFYSVFDDSQGLFAIAPSINFAHSTIIEGEKPQEALPQPGKKQKQQQRENLKQIPTWSDPIGMISYMITTISDYLAGRKSSYQSSNSATTTMAIELIVVFSVIGCSSCCCCLVGGYLIYQFLRFNAAQADMAKKAGVKVASADTDSDDDIPLQNLMTEQQIESRLSELHERKNNLA